MNPARKNPVKPAAYWTYKGGAIQTLAEAIAAGRIAKGTTESDWNKLSPGMKREIVRSNPKRRTRKKAETKKPARKHVAVKVSVSAKNPARKIIKRNPRRRLVTPLRRNPVQHWAIVAITKRQGKLYYYAGGNRFSSSRRAARQYQSRADALSVAKKLLPRLPQKVQALTTREIAA